MKQEKYSNINTEAFDFKYIYRSLKKISDIYPCSYLCDRYTFLYFPGSVYAKYV